MNSATTETPQQKQGQTTISEWGFVLATIAIVLVTSSLPYLFAYLTVPAEKEFMGLAINVADHGQYFAWMRELSDANLSANKQTAEENEPVFFNLLWWGLGHLNAALGLDGYETMYQLLRFTAIPLFMLLTYRVCAWFFDNLWHRRAAFLIATFMSGFGWLLVLYRELFMTGDYQLNTQLLIFISEGITFFCAIGFPHFLGAALYILAFDLMLRGQTKQHYGYAVAAGLVTLFFGLQHTYDLALVYGMLGSFGFAVWFRDKKPPMYLIKSGVIIFLISVWPGIYSVWLTTANPLWGEVLAQFDNAGVFTPKPWLIPVLMGPAFLLALFTALLNKPHQFAGKTDTELFLKVWFWANFALLYIPTDFQIHMLNGWQIPIAILATQGLFRYILPLIKKVPQLQQVEPERLKKGLIAAAILIIIPTNLYILAWRILDLSRYNYPYYLYDTEITALDWIEDNASEEAVVLSSLEVGQYLPALSGSYAFLSHWAQTVRYHEKVDMVAEFFDESTADSRRLEILTNCNPDYDCAVDYVFYGPAEQALGAYNPAEAEFLEPVYMEKMENGVSVYAVAIE